MTANVRFVFVCFGKRFSRGVPFVRSFVYSLDFLLFLTASLLNCGEETRFATSSNVDLCFGLFHNFTVRFLQARFTCVLLYIYSSFFVLLGKQRRCSTDSCRFMAQSLRRMEVKRGAERIFAYFLNVRFPPLAFSSLLTTWIVDALTGQWHSPIASSKPNEKVVEM